MTERHEIEAWLGPALADLTAGQVDRLVAEADAIGGRYPEPDDHDDREAALTAACQYLLGELDIAAAGQQRRASLAAEQRARAAAIQVAAMAASDGMSDAAAAREAGIDRMTLLARLGKRRRATSGPGTLGGPIYRPG